MGVAGHDVGDVGGILDAGTADEQAVGVDAVGYTGNERAEVATVLNGKRFDFCGLYDADLVRLIREGFAEDQDLEDVALGELVEVGEQKRAGKTAVVRR